MQAQPITIDVLLEKYAKKNENSADDIYKRVAKGVAVVEKDAHAREYWEAMFYENMKSGGIGAGRIMSAGGTGIDATLINCFVQPVGDAISGFDKNGIPGIYDALTNAAETMRRGGGVGYNFSRIRPKNAKVGNFGAMASGPCSYINIFDQSCETIESAGCFAGDTLIATTIGLIKIKDIVESDKEFFVITHLGPKKITAKFKNGVKPIWNVTTEYGYNVRVTKDHKFAQFENGVFITKPIKDIYFSKDHSLVLLAPNGVTLVPTWNKEEMLAYLVGAFQGNGTWVWNDEHTKVKGISISNNTTKEDIVDKIVLLAQQLGLNPLKSKRPYENTFEVDIFSVEVFGEWVIKGVNKGNEMSVPSFILQGSDNARAAYVAGMMEADGCISETKSNIRLRLVTKPLLKDIQIILSMFGVPTTLKSERDPIDKWQRLYCLGVYGTLSQERFNNTAGQFMIRSLVNVSSRDRVGFSHSWDNVSGFNKQRKQFSKFWSGDVNKHPNVSMNALVNILSTPELINTISDKIKHIVREAAEETYDLEVEDVHLLSGDGIYTSNSRRGAQMGILNINHPDIEDFIVAKRTPGRWKNFNVSVFVTDEFMTAKENGTDIELIHEAEPGAAYKEAGVYLRDDGNWVYRKVNASVLWDTIMKSNYDFAEPGILFQDTINNDNNLHYCEFIDSTNPCVPADTWIMTDKGAFQVNELIGKTFNALVDGKVYKTLSKGFFSSGVKDVYRLITEEGYELRLTADHKLLKVSKQTRNVFETEWVAAKDLKQSDKIVLNNHTLFKSWSGKGTESEGYLLGLLIGDGWLDEKKATISVWETKVINGTRGVMLAAEDAAFSLPHNENFNGFQQRILSQKSSRMSSAAILKLASDMGVTKENKTITPEIEKASSNFNIGLLRGLFDTDGSVQGNQEKGVSLRLSQSNLNMLLGVQRILLRFGIVSKVYANRRNAERRLLPDGQGNKKYYDCKATHELIISKQNLFVYNDKIGFNDSENSRKIKEALDNYSRTPNKEYFTTTVFALIKDTTEEVFDVTVDVVHAFDANGIMAHNCAEQPLPPYGCCDLGPIVLPKFVKNPFTPNAYFDYNEFIQVVQVQVRFLDNVLDATLWPLSQQKEEAMNKRRIGVGYTGIANALAMLNLPYTSAAGIEEAIKITRTMRDAAYSSSVQLAKERGAFPLLNTKEFLKEGTAASRLPDNIKNDIITFGIRNSHLLSIAPTGTVSLAFADNASNGIEPPFSLVYTRKKRMPDNTFREYLVVDHSLRIFLNTLENKEYSEALLNAISTYKTTFEFGSVLFTVRECIPVSIITAMEMLPLEHLKMLEAVQPYIDTSISKTVNVPADCTFESFKGIYQQAYHSGLKGVSTYRPNAILGSVLSVGTEVKKEEAKDTLPKTEVKEADPFNTFILKRPAGTLSSRTKKVEYLSSFVEDSFYVGVSFLKDIKRPIEVFFTVCPDGVSQEWLDSYAINLSVLARGGLEVFCKSLRALRKVKSDKGQVRYGWHIKADGSKAPKFHSSEVACMAFAIQEILMEEDIIDELGFPKKTIATLPSCFVVTGSLQTTGSSKIEEPIEKKVTTKTNEIIPGKLCNECGAHAVIKVNGCDQCTNCNAIGSCG